MFSKQIHNAKEMLRVKMAKSEYVRLVDEVCSDEPWGPTAPQMDELCRVYHAGRDEILEEIVLRLEHREQSWRRCYKALLLLDHMARSLQIRYVVDLRRLSPLISTIGHSFQYRSTKTGTDHGLSVRERAKRLLALLQDEEHLTEERRKTAMTRDKVQGVSGSGGGDNIGGSGGSHSHHHGGGAGGMGGMGGRYGGFGGSTSASSAEDPNRYNRIVAGSDGEYRPQQQQPQQHRTSPHAANDAGSNGRGTGAAMTQEEADMAFAARLQAEEERASGVRVADTDVGRRLAQQQQQRGSYGNTTHPSHQANHTTAGSHRQEYPAYVPRQQQPQQSQQAHHHALTPAQQQQEDEDYRLALEMQRQLDAGVSTPTMPQPKQPQSSAFGAATTNSAHTANTASQGGHHSSTSLFQADAPAAPAAKPVAKKPATNTLDDLFGGPAPAAATTHAHAGGADDDFFATPTTAPPTRSSGPQPATIAVNNNGGGGDFFGELFPTSSAQQPQQKPPVQHQQQQPHKAGFDDDDFFSGGQMSGNGGRGPSNTGATSNGRAW